MMIPDCFYLPKFRSEAQWKKNKRLYREYTPEVMRLILALQKPWMLNLIDDSTLEITILLRNNVFEMF